MGNRTNMPSGWSSSAIGGACTFSRGVSWKKSQERRAPTAGAVPVLRIPNVQETLELTELLYIDGLTKAQKAKARVKRGWTLLVGSNGNPKRVGNCVYVTEPRDFLFASFLIGATPTDPKQVDSEFLYRLLSSSPVQHDIWQSVQGSTGLSNIDLNSLKGLRVLIPSLPEQRRIAAILSSVDDAIDKTRAVIDQVQVVKRGLMRELLTRGLPGPHTQFKRTAIGEIPDEWQVIELASVASIERGKFAHRPRNDPRFYGGRYPFIQTGDVAACDGLITTYSQTLNEEGLTVSKLFPAGTIVITIAANIGSTGIATFDVAFPDSLIGIQAGPRIDTRFLELVLRTRKRDLNRFAPESAQKNINLDTLKPLKVPLPRMAEQRRIAELLWSIIRREQNAHLYRDGLTRLKSALMSVFLSGELRVTQDTEAA